MAEVCYNRNALTLTVQTASHDWQVVLDIIMNALGLHAALQDFAIKGQFCMGSNRDMDKGSLYREIRYMRVWYKWSRL